MSTQCQNVQSLFNLLDAETNRPVMGTAIRLKGCSVSMGIGQGSSTMSLDLVADNCVDGTIDLPPMGTPVKFNCDKLVFGGIINSLTYTENSSSFDYRMDIVDPKRVLDGVQVMLKTYYCDPIPGAIIANFININKLLEENVAVCPPREDSENWPRINDCTNFGEAGGSQGPFLWKVLQKIQQKYSGGLGAFGDAFYTTSARRIYINMSKLVALLISRAPYARANSLHMSLTELIDMACELLCCDYTILLEGLVATVYLIDRTKAPPINFIKTLFTDAQNSGRLVSGSIGNIEIYAASNRIVIGDSVHYLAEAHNTDTFAMMLGHDIHGRPVRVYGPNFTAKIDITPIIDMLGAANLPNNLPPMFEITEEEILCSASLITWRTYGLLDGKENSLCAQVHNKLGFGDRKDKRLKHVVEALDTMTKARAAIPALDAKGKDFNLDHHWTTIQGQVGLLLKDETLKPIPAKRFAELKATEDAIHGWFNRFIDEYYGKHWLIPVNNICITPKDQPLPIKVRQGDRYALTDEPTDSGYPSVNQAFGMLGLMPGVTTSLFETGDGKISGFGKLRGNYRSIRKINGQDFEHEIFKGKLSAADCMFTVGRKAAKKRPAAEPAPAEPDSAEPDSAEPAPVNDDEIITLYQKIQTDGAVYSNLNPRILTGEVLITTEFIPLAPVLPNVGDRLTNSLRATDFLFGSVIAGATKKLPPESKSLNVFKCRNAAAGFESIVIPMKSNVYVYGPWTSTNPVVGSTVVVEDPSLNPWTSGGLNEMQAIGQSLADQGVRYSNVEESGAITLAELPGYSITYFLDQQVLIDSIVLNYGSGGATTSYSFKQHAQKFGSYQQTISNMIRKNAGERNSILKRLRQQRNDRRLGIAKIANTIDLLRHPEQEASPGFCLIGLYNHPIQEGLSTKKPEVPTAPAAPTENPIPLTPEQICAQRCKDPEDPTDPGTEGSKVTNSHDCSIFDANDWSSFSYGEDINDIQNYAALSLDALFAPVSILGRGDRLPRYTTGLSSKILCKSRPPMPPTDQHPCPDIYQKYLNPILNIAKLDEWDERKNDSDLGVSISRISFGTDLPLIFSALDGRYDEATDFGFFALKGPLVLQSWGYDTQGKPIPNEVDVEEDVCAGKFAQTRLTNKFMKNWLRNPRTWPVAPIDLRYDRDRGVWVSPPPDRIVVARLSETLSPNMSAKAQLLNPDITVSGSTTDFLNGYIVDGNAGEDLVPEMKNGSANSIITIDDYLGVETKSGTIVYAMRNDQRYIILGSSQAGGLKSSIPPSSKQSTSTETGPNKGSYVITQPGDQQCDECKPKEDEEFCPTDACGLSDCVKDIYGRTLKPVISKAGETALEPPFKDADVTIPWGGTSATEGPFGRSSKLPAYSSFASGVLGIDSEGCLKIYPLTSCGIVDPPVTTPPATTPPGGSPGDGGTINNPTPPVSVPVPTPQAPPVAGGAYSSLVEDSSSGFAQNGGDFVVDPPYVFPTPEDICAGVGLNSDGIMGPGGYNDYLDCVRRETEKRFALIRAAQGRG